MPGYRARPNAILLRAMKLGIPPQASRIARATGIPARTVSKALHGAGVSTHTIARLCEALDAPIDDLFERYDGNDEPGPGPLRAVR